MVISIEARWYGAELGFREINKKMKDAREPLKKSMYKYMKGPVKQRFLSGGKPRWKARKKQVAWPMLIKTGTLMRSVTLPSSTNKLITYPDKKSITLESKVPYAPYHDKNRGNTNPNPNIYGRPFLPFTEKDVDGFLNDLADWAWKETQQSLGNK